MNANLRNFALWVIIVLLLLALFTLFQNRGWEAIIADDLVGYGLIPEMIGRLPVITPLAELNTDALVRVLTEPKNALIRQYKKLFGLENCGLEFRQEAIRKMAEIAKRQGTGARGLRYIAEKTMLDLMYHLPDREKQTYVVTEDMIPDATPKTA